MGFRKENTMATRGMLSRIVGSAIQYIQDHTNKGDRRESLSAVDGRRKHSTFASRNPDPDRMTRVTDELGNEYYCPMNMLKENSFVREEEKLNCFDYKILSANRAE
jgi:hypothetical protein